MSTITPEIPVMTEEEKQAQLDAHRDPLSGRAGAHPIATGVGAAAGGAAVGIVTGAVLGTVAGPMGTAVGAALGAAAGAVSGGLAGKALAEEIDPTVEHGFWREYYVSRTYFVPGMLYEDYAPAYQFGWESEALHQGKTFDQIEATLQHGWDKAKGASKLAWHQAKEAVRDSWNRVGLHRTRHSS